MSYLYSVEKKINTVQSLNCYYYYYYFGGQCLSVEASKIGEHSSMFGSYILGCLNSGSVLGYLRANYLLN
jgi:hypothetical protein